jgi:uncharacterized protein (DUF2147 family)
MKMRISGVAATCATAFLMMLSPALAGVQGVWSTQEDKSRVQIVPCGDKLCGEIIWLKEPNDDKGNPKIDKNNQNENLKTRSILGLKLLNGFVANGENKWGDGKIYNPEDGKTYSSNLKLVGDDVLEVEGCVFIFCKAQTWTRVAD